MNCVHKFTKKPHQPVEGQYLILVKQDSREMFALITSDEISTWGDFRQVYQIPKTQEIICQKRFVDSSEYIPAFSMGVLQIELFTNNRE